MPTPYAQVHGRLLVDRNAVADEALGGGRELELDAGQAPDTKARLLAALAGEVTESILVVDSTGRITAMLGGGLLRRDRTGTRIFDHCHPRDLPELLRLAATALASIPGWHEHGAVRIRDDGGTWCHVVLQVRNRRDDPVVDGFVLRLRERPAATLHPPLTASTGVARELESLAGAIPLPIMFLDPSGLPSFVNDAARSLCAHLLGPLSARGLAGIVEPQDRPLVEETLRSLRDYAGERTTALRLLTLRPGDAERFVEATFSARSRRDGGDTIVVTLVDVTTHRARESELLRIASCDPLTGLLNRAEIEEALAERLRMATEGVALLYVDLDGFKAVNDNHGHDVGDDLLVEIARILDAKTRPGDLVARLGGDEFAIVVNSPDLCDAHGLACRIAVAIAELSAYRHLPVSASVGAATARPGDTARDLLRRADAAMYDEKRRTRIVRSATR